MDTVLLSWSSSFELRLSVTSQLNCDLSSSVSFQPVGSLDRWHTISQLLYPLCHVPVSFHLVKGLLRLLSCSTVFTRTAFWCWNSGNHTPSLQNCGGHCQALPFPCATAVLAVCVCLLLWGWAVMVLTLLMLHFPRVHFCSWTDFF